MGDSMRRTAAVLLAAAIAAGGAVGCSNSSEGGEPKATATVTATKTPTLSAEEARVACVEAWADTLQQDAEAGVDQEPVECVGLPEGDRLDRYMEGLQERNARNRG
ncbi:hypothetical protein ACFWH4_10725 [Streptomyces sp. NPDC127091]|uniref:hypothetical protein n=1 Tax=Streptomyces sp. NPDC127091 TaxID=3347134 RepID=UPI00366141E7